MAISAFGTILQLSNGAMPAVYASIAEIRSITPAAIDRDMIDVTHMESPGGWKEYLAGMIDGGTVELELNYIVQDASHKDMLANLEQQTLANAMRAYRVVFPDFGATAFTATESGSVWTTASAHGWHTPQPVTFSTTETLPTSTPQILPGHIYWARYASATTFTLFATSADAAANANQITFSTSGTGTHTVSGGSALSLTGAFKSAKLSGQQGDRLAISTTLKVSGVVSLTP